MLSADEDGERLALLDHHAAPFDRLGSINEAAAALVAKLDADGAGGRGSVRRRGLCHISAGSLVASAQFRRPNRNLNLETGWNSAWPVLSRTMKETSAMSTRPAFTRMKDQVGLLPCHSQFPIGENGTPFSARLPRCNGKR
jgi:hypothetical protein